MTLPLPAHTLRLIRSMGFFFIGMILLGALAYFYAIAPEVSTRPLFWIESILSVALVLYGANSTYTQLRDANP